MIKALCFPKINDYNIFLQGGTMTFPSLCLGGKIGFSAKHYGHNKYTKTTHI